MQGCAAILAASSVAVEVVARASPSLELSVSASEFAVSVAGRASVMAINPTLDRRGDIGRVAA